MQENETKLLTMPNKSEYVSEKVLEDFFKGMLASIPIIGPIAGMAITGLQATDDYDRIMMIFNLVNSKLTLDDLKAFLETKDGRYFFRGIMEKAMKVRNEDKAKAFARILASEVKQGSIDWSETVVRTIYELTDAELHIFQVVATYHPPESVLIEGLHLKRTETGTRLSIGTDTPQEKKIAISILASRGVLIEILGASPAFLSGLSSVSQSEGYELSDLGKKMWEYFQEI